MYQNFKLLTNLVLLCNSCGLIKRPLQKNDQREISSSIKEIVLKFPVFRLVYKKI